MGTKDTHDEGFTAADDEPTELEVTEASERKRADLAAFRKAIETGELEVEIDTAAIARRIASEIMDAPDLEAALKGKPTWSAKDAVGRRFELRGLHLNLSSYEESSPVYASIDAVDLDTGEVGILNTTSGRQLATLYVAERDNRWPVRVQILYADAADAPPPHPLKFELIVDEPAEG